jgi:hypothetical protein
LFKDVDSTDFASHPVKSFFKLHGRFGIGAIKIVDGFLSTIGRDGIIQTIEVDENVFASSTNKIEDQIRKGGSTRLRFSWLEKVFAFRGKTFLLGFHSDQFIVYNLSDHNVACEMSCGGSHRSWTYTITDDSFVFTFVKDRAIEQFRY